MAKIIGIDLGTTNSAVSVYEMGTSRTIQLKGDMTTPSVIWKDKDGNFVVGREAKQHIPSDPGHVLVSTKRDLGSDTTYNIDGESFTPTDCASMILAYLKREASIALKDEINDAVITVPAYFGFQEIGEVRKAAIDAGLNPIAIIPEPTSAAIRYGIGMEAKQLICVVDLGGGTFDVTVLQVNFDKKRQKHVINPVNWDGDHYLGGDDFDNAIIDWMIENGAKGFTNKLELKSVAESAKIDLASISETQISHPKYLSGDLVLRRDEYEGLIKDKLQKIGETIKKTIRETIVDGQHVDMDDINRFVLVGGSCKHPVVKDYIQNIIGRQPYNAPNIDTFVADGASLFHHALKTPGSGIDVERKLPRSLGTDLVRDDERINAIILEKGTPIPCRAIQFATLGAESPGLQSYVVEGEERLYENNKQIDEIYIPLEYTGYEHLIFTEFILDESSVLSFNTYCFNINDSNVDRLAEALPELLENLSGDAALLDTDMWSKFYAEFETDITVTPKDLTLNI